MAWVLAFALILSSSKTAQDGSTDTGVAVHVTVDQDGGLTLNQLSRAIDQVRQIWRSVGVSVTVGRHGEPAPSGATRVSLRLVHHHRTIADVPILAWVSLAETGQPTPAVFVSIAGITSLLSSASVRGRPFGERPLALRETLIGQAVGRVLAHELGHYLLRSARHADVGLMRPRYSSADLIAPYLGPFQVSRPDRPLVRRELAKLAQSGGAIRTAQTR